MVMSLDIECCAHCVVLDERGDDGVHCIVVLDECGDEPSGSR